MPLTNPWLAGPTPELDLPRAQVFGTARTLERDDPLADPYWEALRWQSDHVERGRSLHEPPRDPLTVLTPTRILYTDHWLRRTGHRPRQTWRPAPA